MSFWGLSDGGHLYYEDGGRGSRTVLMLHGWTSTHEIFEQALPKIREKARCIVYDQRGHGRSKGAGHGRVTMDTLADDLHELICGLGLEDLILVGWSMGAGVVLNYISLYGCGALRRVVLCDMTPRLMNDENWKLGLYQGNYTEADMERDRRRSFYSLYRNFAVGAIPRLARLPDFLLKVPLERRLFQCHEETLKSLSLSMKEKDYREVVGQIRVPVHYFYPVPGSLFSPALADWYRNHVSSPFSVVAFLDSTHMMITEHPRQFAQEILRVTRMKE